MKSFVCITVKIILVLLIVATIINAFYQSSLPPEVSKETSDKVGEIIEEVIPPETDAGAFVQKNLRKLAHFTEFFFLGLWASLYTALFLKKRKISYNLLPFGLIVAILDETVQIFSKRGPSVTDVWIDALGYAVAVALVLLAALILLLIKHINRIREGRIAV